MIAKINREYSEAEEKLFSSLGIKDLMEHITPPALYRFAVEKAFISNLSGNNVEALRRGAKAVLVDSKPFRMTEEFDKLISFEGTK